MSASGTQPGRRLGSLVILASGRGSNARAIAQAIERGLIPAQVLGVICDQPQAPVLEWAAGTKLAHALIEPRAGEARTEFDARWQATVAGWAESAGTRFEDVAIVLAGWMRVLSREGIERCREATGLTRIVNVHPSLLPAFPGLHGYAQALAYGAALAGVSVHTVEPRIDSGPVLAQEAFSIVDCQNVSEVEMRGLAVEHRLYTETLGWWLAGAYAVAPAPPLAAIGSEQQRRVRIVRTR